MPDRRTVMRGIAALPLGAAAAATATTRPAQAGPIALMAERYTALVAEINAGAGDERADEAHAEAYGLQLTALHHQPASLVEAAAALAWGRVEFVSQYVECPEPDKLDLWTLHMLDGALRVLQQAAAGAALG